MSTKNKKNTSSTDNLLDKVNNYLKKRSSLIFSIIMFLFLLLTLINFDLKLSIEHDDALYIKSAYKYATDFTNNYHTANAPFYPMFMAVIVAIFGLKLGIIKICSTIFMFISLVMFYKALKDKISYVLLFSSLSITAFCFLIVYFSYHAFTEAFFMMLQSIFLYLFVKIHDDIFIENNFPSIKQWLLFGLMLFLLPFTKSVLYAIIPVLVVFFLFYKQVKAAIYTVVSFGIFQGLFSIIKPIVWAGVNTSSAHQMKKLLQKDPYKPEEGMEDFAGFLTRIYDNFELYISKRLYDLLSITPNSTETSGFLLFITFVLLGITFYWAFKKKDKITVFLFLYASSLVFASCVMLQARWDQPRIIMIYLPIIVILLFYGLYQILHKRNIFALNILFVFIALIILPIAGFKRTFSQSKDNIVTIRKNLNGNKYAGYTPDWVNYIKMSEWVAQPGNLPEGSYVACRKPPVSFVHSGGMDFFGIYSVPSENADTLLMKLKKNGVTHVIMANLRRDPNRKTEYTINTVRRYLYNIQKKYPNALVKVHQIGDSEEAILFKINYPY